MSDPSCRSLTPWYPALVSAEFSADIAYGCRYYGAVVRGRSGWLGYPSPDCAI